MIYTCRLVVTVAINCVGLLGLYVGKFLSLFITTRAEWCHTLWTWRKIRWRSCQRRSRVNCRWSCLAQSWSLSNGGNFETKRIWRRSRITWTSEESS